MATFTYTIATPTSPAVEAPISEVDKLFGRDVYMALDTATSPAGDWTLVEGEEALKQSLRHRTVTNPGEFRTRPDYGVGAGMYVRARQTQATRAELAGRIRQQYLRDQRVLAVEDVAMEWSDGLLKLAVGVTAKGTPLKGKAVLVTVEVN